MNNKITIRYRVEYSFTILYHLLSRVVPLRIWLFLGKCLGLLFYFLDRHHRKITLRNLRFAYGKEKDEKEIRLLARKNFQQFGMIGHEWIRLLGLTNKNLNKICNRIYVEGQKHLIAAREKNRSIILLSAHFGNWEYAHLFFSSTINHLNFIVRRIDNPILERERVAYNQHFGVRILYKENGLRTAIRNLKKGEDLIIFTDRKADLREGIPCQFFGKKTSTIPLVAALAKKFHIPVVPMFIVRCKDMVHHRIIFLPELKVGYNNGQSVSECTQLQNDITEKVIRKYSDHWLWFHRKWKCYHPEIYES